MIEPQPGMAPREIIPGNADEVDRMAGQLARFARNATEAGRRLSGLDSEHWSGRAAEQFRTAVSEVPDLMKRGAAAFDSAVRELTAYSHALRDGQRAADRAIGLADQAAQATAVWRRSGAIGADPGEALRLQARRLADQAADDVRRAALAAAQRLGQLADQAPTGGANVLAGAVRYGGTEIGTTVDHHLERPDDYVAPLDQVAADVQFGADHHADFAGGGDDWGTWSGDGDGRSVGSVSTDTVAGAALLLLGGARRRRRTALESAGMDTDELSMRRAGFGRRGEGTAARSAGGWRTNLTGRPRSGAAIRAWAGPEGNPLRHTSAATAVTLAPAGLTIPGVVLHSGPPAEQESPGRAR
jgi:hypothetical protein